MEIKLIELKKNDIDDNEMIIKLISILIETD